MRAARSLAALALVALAAGAPGAAGAPLPAAAQDPAAALLEKGRALAAKGDADGAWRTLGEALRAAATAEGKDAVRDALLALPLSPAPSLTPAESDLVLARIEEERARYLRDRANALLGRGKLRGALALLEVVRGALEEEATAKVLGDPKGAERRTKESADLRVRILGTLPDAERVEADERFEAWRADPARVLREAARWRREKRDAPARRLLLQLVQDPRCPEEPRAAARAALAEVEAALLAALDAEERRAVDEALACPVFQRLQPLPSREFILLGDRDLVARIPEASRRSFDLAYLALTDLAGRVPNPDGRRVTVFFKELWDFPGGVGGGARIDIGRADPRSKQAVLVATPLLFHELSHCVFDFDGLPGWVEGVADLGAVAACAFLKLDAEAKRLADRAREAWRAHYLDREEPPWRMASYGPTAGWLLSLGEAHGRRAAPATGIDWTRYGRVFRAWRAAAARLDEAWDRTTVAERSRAFAAILEAEFGPGAAADLRAARFPAAGEPLLPAAGAAVRGWRVAGPFYAPPGGDALGTPLPPEREVLFGAEYPSTRQVARWFTPSPPGAGGGGGPVTEDADGRGVARWAYPQDSTTYALAEFEIPAPLDGYAWVATEHRWSLRIDDALVESQDWGQGHFVPARDRVPVRLAAGRHRLLLKLALGWSGPSWQVHLTDRDGAAPPGLRVLEPAERPATPPPEPKGARVLAADFAAGALPAAWRPGPGGFEVRNKAARGTASDGGVPWRPYSVRPGFPQDSPSNSLTLDPREAARAGEDLRVLVELEPSRGRPRVAITLDAEEGPGALTGWTVVVSGAGEGVQARVERYDRTVGLSAEIPVPAAEAPRLEVWRRRGLLSARLDGVLLVDRFPAPALARRGLRLSTWGRDPAIRRLVVERLE